MPLKRYYKLIPLAGMCLMFPFFFYGGPAGHSLRSFMAAWNLGHPLFFMLFTCYLGRMKAGKISWASILRIFGLILLIGSLIEIIQSGIAGRTASSLDVVRDLMGGVLGVVWLRWSYSSLKARLGLALIAGTVLCWNLYPVTTALVDEWQAKRDFPLLAGFEHPYELSRWTEGNSVARRSRDQARQGHFSLRVSLNTATYSGVHLEYFPHNWQGFSFLSFSIYNNVLSPLAVTVRINDKKHEERQQLYKDRYNRSFILQHGWNDIKISLADVRNAPENREMNMSEISELGFFVIRQKTDKVFFLDAVRLI